MKVTLCLLFLALFHTCYSAPTLGLLKKLAGADCGDGAGLDGAGGAGGPGGLPGVGGPGGLPGAGGPGSEGGAGGPGSEGGDGGSPGAGGDGGEAGPGGDGPDGPGNEGPGGPGSEGPGGAPSGPGGPGVPGLPTGPGGPGLPGLPTGPGGPGVPGLPTGPGGPGVPGVPGGPGVPCDATVHSPIPGVDALNPPSKIAPGGVGEIAGLGAPFAIVDQTKSKAALDVEKTAETASHADLDKTSQNVASTADDGANQVRKAADLVAPGVGDAAFGVYTAPSLLVHTKAKEVSLAAEGLTGGPTGLVGGAFI